MMTARRIPALAVIAAVAGLLSGCASTSLLPGHGRAGAGAVGRDGPPADAAQVAVARHWASALLAGDVQTAAGLFHLPSVFVNGPTDSVEIENRHQAVLINSSLPCGARFISAFQDGRYVNVLFRLVARHGQGGGPTTCTGIGSTARTDFLIRGGQIVEWVRAPSRPGDPSAPKSSGGGPSQPVSGQRKPAASAA